MTSSVTIRTVDEVFGITRNLPLNYVERADVDGRLRGELGAAHHVVIYGSSKQGKTSLRKRCMNSSEYILVQCSNRSDIADLHSNILKRAGFEITLSQKRSSSGRHKVVASLKAAMKATFFGQGVQMEGTAGAERETTTGTEQTTAALELDSWFDTEQLCSFRDITGRSNCANLSFQEQCAVRLRVRGSAP